MDSVELTQKELIIIFNIINRTQYGIADAEIVIPLSKKIKSLIKEEPTTNTVANSSSTNVTATTKEEPVTPV